MKDIWTGCCSSYKNEGGHYQERKYGTYTKYKKKLLMYDSESWFQRNVPNEEEQLKDLRPSTLYIQVSLN